MDATEYRRNLSGALTLKELSDDPSFLDGYIRGLRRCYHGQFFETEEEHRKWMAFADETGDDQCKAKGEGYRQGVSGATVADISQRGQRIRKLIR